MGGQDSTLHLADSPPRKLTGAFKNISRFLLLLNTPQKQWWAFYWTCQSSCKYDKNQEVVRVFSSVITVVEFHREAGEIQCILHPNEHPERICSYLVRQFEAELAKIGHFQISKSIFEAKYDSIFLKPKFLFEYQIRRTTFIKSIYLSTILVKLI